MITLPGCMASHIGNTFQKIARTLKGVLHLTEGNAVGGLRVRTGCGKSVKSAQACSSDLQLQQP